VCGKDRRRARQRRAETGDRPEVRRCGAGKPKYGQLTVCWAKSREEAKRTAFENWPNVLVDGSASQELPPPKDFEQLVEDREPDDLEGTLPLGPDPGEYTEQLQQYAQAGYTHVCVHQIGSDQQGFLDFAKRELVPGL
jgi:coenzyme F420-dependent glucose-6-phosphate dehydrogenase